MTFQTVAVIPPSRLAASLVLLILTAAVVAACEGVVEMGNPQDGLTDAGQDLDAGNPCIPQGAEDICDGIDNDCDGATDEDCECMEEGETKPCGLSEGECVEGEQACVSGAWEECSGGRGPQQEQCNGLDDDCDGTKDEGCACAAGEQSECGSDVGECKRGVQKCEGGVMGACEGAVGAVAETCDGKDNDCDGETDENFPRLGQQCDGNDADQCKNGTFTCPPNGRSVHCVNETVTDIEEVLNGQDDDCDGETDEGLEPPEPENVRPCENGSCWHQNTQAAVCGRRTIAENFSTGRYNAHEWATMLHEEALTRITLTRTGGEWQPAIVIIEDGGRVLSDGSIGLSRAGIDVTVVQDGREGAMARARIVTETDRNVLIYVTGWEAVDSGFVDFLPTSATYRLEIESICDNPPDLIAPDGALPGEVAVDEGEQVVQVGSGSTWGPPLRVDALQREHVGFKLTFQPSSAVVSMQLLAWNGAEAAPLGLTDWGPGLRVLAGFDPFGSRTFWIRAKGNVNEGTLTVTRTLFDDGAVCSADCARLLQLPLPVDSLAQGYATASWCKFAYQFGRRELLMAILHAGMRIAESGIANPFTVGELSRWDGQQSGGHQTHEGGYHVDISVYDSSGHATWESPGAQFGDAPMAMLIAGIFESEMFSGRQVILDTMYHDDVRDGAAQLLDQGEISPEIFALFAADRGIIYDCMPSCTPHTDHIHVRIDRR